MNRIKEKRIKAGFTQYQVSKEIGCTQAAIAQYESGKRQPSFKTLIKLAKLYECTVNDFVEV